MTRPDKTVVALLLTAITGAVLLVVGYEGVSHTLLPGQQLPWLVSAGAVGLALIGTGLAVLALYLERRQLALRSQQTDRLLQETTRLMGAIERAATRRYT